MTGNGLGFASGRIYHHQIQTGIATFKYSRMFHRIPKAAWSKGSVMRAELPLVNLRVTTESDCAVSSRFI
jgi:hypothetical protein